MKKSPLPHSALSAFLLCLLLLSATSCRHRQRPPEVLDAGAMADFLTELYLVEGYFAIESQYSFDKASPEVLSVYDNILEKQYLSRERIEKSFDYYSQHPEEYKAIQDDVAVRIGKLITPDEEPPQE